MLGLKAQEMLSTVMSRRYCNQRFTIPELLAIGFVLLFVALRLPYFVGPAYVFDEERHTLAMQTLRVANFEAFGAAYWVSGYLLIKIFGAHALLVMRLLAFASLSYTGYVVYRIANKSNRLTAPFVFFVAATSPVFWFGGKLITPEFYQLALISLVVAKSFEKRDIPKWGYFLLGFVVGVKLSAITLVLFIIAIYGRKFESRNAGYVKYFFLIFGLFVLGFILSSPNIVYDPIGYKKLFFSNIGHPNGLRPDFWTMKILTWDYIQDWGFFYYINPFALLALSIFMIVNRNWKVLSVSLGCIGLLIFLVLKNESFLPWHAFLTVAVIWFAFATAKPIEGAPVGVLQICLIACIALNAAVSFPQYKLDWKGQQEFFRQQKSQQETDDCLSKFSDKLSVKWGQTHPLICYSSYRFNGEWKGFCDPSRLSKVLTSSNWSPKVFELNNVSRVELGSLLTDSPVIFLENKNIEKIYGPDNGEQSTYLRSMEYELKSENKIDVASKVVGMCGAYQILQYEMLNPDRENKK